MLTGERWRTGGDLRVAATRVAVAGAWTGALVLAAHTWAYYALGHAVGMDAHAYWVAGRVAHPYQAAPGHADAYLYSPLFAQAMRLPAMLPWPLFLAGFLLAISTAYAWLAWPLPMRWRVPVLLACSTEVAIGNVYALLAVALVFAVTGRPAAVAFPALTKISPGVVPWLWLLGRREWRRAAIGAASVVALALASLLASPGLWREWVAFTFAHGGDRGWLLLLRLAMAFAAAVIAARQDWHWLLALAYLAAMPMAGGGVQSACILVALVRLSSTSRRAGSTPAATDGTVRPVVLTR